jgi:hypothetical protein
VFLNLLWQTNSNLQERLCHGEHLRKSEKSTPPKAMPQRHRGHGGKRASGENLNLEERLCHGKHLRISEKTTPKPATEDMREAFEEKQSLLRVKHYPCSTALRFMLLILSSVTPTDPFLKKVNPKVRPLSPGGRGTG